MSRLASSDGSWNPAEITLGTVFGLRLVDSNLGCGWGTAFRWFRWDARELIARDFFFWMFILVDAPSVDEICPPT